MTCQLWKFAGSFTPLIEVACRWLSQDLEIETLYPIESRPVVEQVSSIVRDESYYLTLMTKRILASLDNGQPYQLVISSSAFPTPKYPYGLQLHLQVPAHPPSSSTVCGYHFPDPEEPGAQYARTTHGYRVLHQKTIGHYGLDLILHALLGNTVGEMYNIGSWTPRSCATEDRSIWLKSSNPYVPYFTFASICNRSFKSARDFNREISGVPSL